MMTFRTIIWIQFGISIIGSALLLSMWSGIQKKFRQQLEIAPGQPTARKDLGLVFLSFAIFFWALMSLWSYISNHAGIEDPIEGLGFAIISTFNNLGLLLSTFYMRGAPRFIHRNPGNLRWSAGLLVVLSTAIGIILAVLDPSEIRGESPVFWLGMPDMIISMAVVGLLAFSITRTFLRMGQPVFAIIAAFVFGVGMLIQLPSAFPLLPVFGENELTFGIRLGTKIGSIFVFLVLGTAWAIELGSMEKPQNLRIAFPDYENTVRITVPNKSINNQEIRLRPKQYSVLLRFALRKKGSRDKTLIRVGKGGEFEQTYLSRVISDLNKGLKEVGINGDSSLERGDLLNFIGQGRYELRVQRENILLDEGVLRRFLHSLEDSYVTEDEDYRAFVANCSQGF